MEKETENLRKVPLFGNFSEDALKEFSGTFERRSYGAGDVVFEEGSAGDTLFIIVSGQVAIEKKLDRDGSSFKQLAILSEGEFFGEMALLEQQPRFAQARAEKPSSLYEIKRGEFFRFISEHPGNGIAVFTEFVKVIAKRLQHTSSELTMLFDMSRLILRPYGSAEEFVRNTVEEIAVYFDGPWNFRGYVYDQFNDEFVPAVDRKAFSGGSGEAETTGRPDSGWLNGSSYRMVFRAHGKPAGYIVFSRRTEVSGYERNELSTIFSTISSIMGSAIENIENRTEAAMREKLKLQKDSI